MYPVYLITCNHPSYGHHIMPYVGCIYTKGKTIEQRFAEHFKDHKRYSSYLHHAMDKYGREWFLIEQIDAGNTPEQALELEAFWIKRFGTYGDGYNMTEGGKGSPGYKMSKESRAKISKALQGNQYRLGIPHTEDMKAKISKSLTGVPCPARGNRENGLKLAEYNRERGPWNKGMRMLERKPRPKSTHNWQHTKKGITDPNCPFCF